MSQKNQASLLAKIRGLSKRIVELQGFFDLPRGHKDRFETYGGAQSLQTARIKRQGIQGQLDPLRVVATGISCRDCLHFGDVTEPRCYNMWNRRLATDGWTTKQARANDGVCGPEARWFQPVAAHA